MPAITDILSPGDLTGGNLQLLARGVVDGFLVGLHRSPHKGSSAEFRQHRPYVPGDDLRTLDWKIYGKTDRFFVREYEEETNLRCTILLDTSASMAYGRGETQKHAYAVRLAACLAHLMLRQQDAVGLGMFDGRLRSTLPSRATPRHLGLVIDALAGAESASEREATDFNRVFHDVATRITQDHRRGLVVLLTDGFGDPEALRKGLGHLRHARNEVIVFQVLHRDEIEFPFGGKVRFDDLEVAGHRREIDAKLLRARYLQRMEAFREKVAAACMRAKTDLVPTVTDEPYAMALRQYLVRRQRSGPVAGGRKKGAAR